jgi:hypothetical protein
MSATRGVRGIVAGLFLMSIASVGVIATMAPAGAGIDGGEKPNCREEHQNNNTDNASSDAATSFKEDGRHCATLEVTKVVTGTPQASPPPGTEFKVHVNCVKAEDEKPDARNLDSSDLPIGQKPPIEEDLTFPAEGGTQSIQIITSQYHPIECTTSETPPAGCTLTSIDPEKTVIEPDQKLPAAIESAPQSEPEPDVHAVTVTNNCNPPPQSQPAGARVQRWRS